MTKVDLYDLIKCINRNMKLQQLIVCSPNMDTQ
jgi:hypothetical protein